MRQLITQSEQSVLLPKRGGDLFLVLFYRSSANSFESLVAELGDLRLPTFRSVAVDLDSAPALADRFGLATSPVLAAIFDGTLLCLEDELGADSAISLAELAVVQLRAYLGVAS